MSVTIPLEVYEEFEKGLGKEGAKKVVKGLETVISDAAEYKWKVTKDEILDAMRKEFVTRELFDEKMNTLRIELEGKIENVRVGLEGKIELVKTDIKRLDMKLTFLIILMIVALTLMNPVMAEIIKNLLKL